MSLLRVSDEELGLVGVRSRVSHGYDTTGVKLQGKPVSGVNNTSGGLGTDLERGTDLVWERFPPDGLPAFPRVCRITCLDHEVLDVASNQRGEWSEAAIRWGKWVRHVPVKEATII